MSSNWVNDMRKMYKKYRFDKEEMTPEKFSFRMDLLNEEVDETNQAAYDLDSEEVVDGLIDICVIAIGTLNLLGVDTQEAWTEVMRANMSKERGIKKGREQSGGFDIIKPNGWKGPSHKHNHGQLDKIFIKPVVINQKSTVNVQS